MSTDGSSAPSASHPLPTSPCAQGEEKRPLGLWMATALVVGSMIGSGVFLLPAALAPYGAASLVGWAIALCGALLLAATFAKLAVHWPCTGGPYAYVRRSFGDVAGFGIAWSYWISIWSGMAAIAVAFAGSMGAIFPALTATPVRAATCALVALWVCTAVNLVGLRQAGRLQVVATALKLLPLLLFGIVALWFVDAGNYVPFNPSGASLPSVANTTVILTMWALCGLEVATVPAGSIRDPERTIPRATLLGTLLAGIATILACTVVIGLVPTEVLKGSGAPMAEAASRVWGPGAALAIAVLAAVSTFGAINGWVMVCAQVSLAAAGDGLFPRAFARLDRNGTPAFGIIVGSVLATVLVIASYSRSLVELFTFILLISTSAILLPYAASSAAWLRSGAGHGGRVVAALALLYSLYALSGAGAEALAWGVVLLLAGVPCICGCAGSELGRLQARGRLRHPQGAPRGQVFPAPEQPAGKGEARCAERQRQSAVAEHRREHAGDHHVQQQADEGLQRRRTAALVRIHVQDRQGHDREHQRDAEGVEADRQDCPWQSVAVDQQVVAEVGQRGHAAAGEPDVGQALPVDAPRGATGHERTEHHPADHRDEEPAEIAFAQAQQVDHERRRGGDVEEQRAEVQRTRQGQAQEARPAQDVA
jgi:APA family basic amino acid/polyamine antiporter